MKVIILAAGYAKRLYPLTLDQPKPLLSVGGRPILNHLLDKAVSIDEINGIFVITNNSKAQLNRIFAFICLDIAAWF